MEQKKKVLLIEDQPDLQRILTDMFSHSGIESISAYDGEVGLQKAKEEKPDMIILDLILPKLSGLEVLSAIRQNPETQHTPVIVLSNLEEVSKIQKVLEMGGTSYFVKTNYTLDELLKRVRQQLGLGE